MRLAEKKRAVAATHGSYIAVIYVVSEFLLYARYLWYKLYCYLLNITHLCWSTSYELLKGGCTYLFRNILIICIAAIVVVFLKAGVCPLKQLTGKRRHILSIFYSDLLLPNNLYLVVVSRFDGDWSAGLRPISASTQLGRRTHNTAHTI